LPVKTVDTNFVHGREKKIRGSNRIKHVWGFANSWLYTVLQNEQLVNNDVEYIKCQLNAKDRVSRNYVIFLPQLFGSYVDKYSIFK